MGREGRGDLWEAVNARGPSRRGWGGPDAALCGFVRLKGHNASSRRVDLRLLGVTPGGGEVPATDYSFPQNGTSQIAGNYVILTWRYT